MTNLSNTANMSNELKQEIITACQNWDMTYAVSHNGDAYQYQLSAPAFKMYVFITNNRALDVLCPLTLDIALQIFKSNHNTVITAIEKIPYDLIKNPAGSFFMTTIQRDLLDICDTLTKRRLTSERNIDPSYKVNLAAEALREVNEKVIKSKSGKQL